MQKTSEHGLCSLFVSESAGLSTYRPAPALPVGRWSAGQGAELRAGPPEATRVRPRRAAGGVRRTVEPAAWCRPRGFVTVSRPSLGVLTGKAYRVGSGSTWQTGGGAQCWVDGGVYALVFSCTTPSRVQLRRRLREPLPGQTTSKILCVFISEDGL